MQLNAPDLRAGAALVIIALTQQMEYQRLMILSISREVMRILKERLLTLVELLKELIQRENFRSSGSR